MTQRITCYLLANSFSADCLLLPVHAYCEWWMGRVCVPEDVNMLLLPAKSKILWNVTWPVMFLLPVIWSQLHSVYHLCLNMCFESVDQQPHGQTHIFSEEDICSSCSALTHHKRLVKGFFGVKAFCNQSNRSTKRYSPTVSPKHTRQAQSQPCCSESILITHPTPNAALSTEN